MMRFLTRVAISLGALALIWAGALAAFLFNIPMRTPAIPDSVNVGVVLTGGAGRIDAGLRLLGEDKIQRLFISGVNEEATPAELLAAARARLQDEFPALKAKQIDIGYAATSTIGNADETRDWLIKEEVQSFRLITANYHIPRSMIEFRAVLPKSMRVYPSPVFADEFTRFNWWQNERTRRLILTEYHKCLASMLRHVIIRMQRST